MKTHSLSGTVALAVALIVFLLFGNSATGALPNCNCYFHQNCATGQRCVVNPADKRTPGTDGIICHNINKDENARTPDPDDPNVVVDDCPNSPGTGPACDGVCIGLRTSDPDVGCEDVTLATQAFELWTQAITGPALFGGGPVDKKLALAALALPFLSENSTREVARGVLSYSELAVGEGFITHLPTIPHLEEDHIMADLSNDLCRKSSLALGTAALAAEFRTLGAGDALIDQIPIACSSVFPPVALTFGEPCTGPDALNCLREDIKSSALFLRLCVRDIVDPLVTFTTMPPFRTTSSTGGCPSGFVGKFSFDARLTNNPDSPFLFNLRVQIASLTNGNLLQNADAGPDGDGGKLTVPVEGLRAGQFVDVPFTICLKEQTPFSFLVNVLGFTD